MVTYYLVINRRQLHTKVTNCFVTSHFTFVLLKIGPILQNNKKEEKKIKLAIKFILKKKNKYLKFHNVLQTQILIIDL